MFDSAGAKRPITYTQHEAENLFGGHQLKDFTVLSQVGKGIKVVN